MLEELFSKRLNHPVVAEKLVLANAPTLVSAGRRGMYIRRVRVEATFLKSPICIESVPETKLVVCGVWVVRQVFNQIL